MNNNTSLFLSQSYRDAQDEYRRVLHNDNCARWDYIILTASNEKQAETFRMQLKIRKLPAKTHFAVIPDEGGVRVGSGGATLSVIKYIAEREGKADFSSLRILVIHSGGDSKRVPQYSALGKLFSPVPHKLDDGRSSTLFDEFMIAMSAMPARIGAGMLLLSGDIVLLFNPLLVDYSGRGAAAISFKEDVNTGKNHGVYLRGEDGFVRQFLHKQSVETLSALGAVNDRNQVDIDTGAIIFSHEMLTSLYSLIDTPEKYRNTVNSKVRLSLYGDFQYPLASDSTLEKFYLEKPEGEYCDELTDARRQVWDALRPYRMKLLRLAPAKFLHFGTCREILSLVTNEIDTYKNLGWDKHINCTFDGETAGYNSVLSPKATIGRNCYLETSYVHSEASVGSSVILSYVDIHDETVPDNVVLHGLKQMDGRFVCRIFGIGDNSKENKLFGLDLDEVCLKAGISADDLWHGNEEHNLWNARLYPVCDTMTEAVKQSLMLYDAVNGNTLSSQWLNAERTSLMSGFNSADPAAIIDWDRRMAQNVTMEIISGAVRERRPASSVSGLLNAPLTENQARWLKRKTEKYSTQEDGYKRVMRLHHYISVAQGETDGEEESALCFKTISDAILSGTLSGLTENKNAKIKYDRHEVRLPLRVNWGGGWSDTPPYCNERGGTVINAAISLNGALPVSVILETVDEAKIVFDSRDMDVHGEFTDISELQRTGDPYDSFALQKAALLACGIIPLHGGDLKEILRRLTGKDNGGFIMHSEVTGVPKGSGLGTSSILAGACVKCLLEFTGLEYDESKLYNAVLAMEQIMSTGGGWQDQVGGLSGGIKFITSKPGLKQTIQVEHLSLDNDTAEELNRRFCLIYTGQRRLARNILREVVGRYVGSEEDSLKALDEIQRVAALMRFELLRGNVDAFASLLSEQWILAQRIDEGSTNIVINQILDSIDDLVDGRMICGAGGGGFLQVILKKDVCRDDLRNRLKTVFADSDIDVWDCNLI